VHLSDRRLVLRMTAASIAALTVYDMCKAVEKGIVIREVRAASGLRNPRPPHPSLAPVQVRLLSRSGGKSGPWRAAERSPDTS